MTTTTTTTFQENYMDLLPEDIKNYIYSFAPLNIIIKSWRIYERKKNVSTSLLQKLNADTYINVMNPNTCIILRYCLKFISINAANNQLYYEIMYKIIAGLFDDRYTGGRGAIHYNETEVLFHKYLVKLNFNDDDIANIHTYLL